MRRNLENRTVPKNMEGFLCEKLQFETSIEPNAGPSVEKPNFHFKKVLGTQKQKAKLFTFFFFLTENILITSRERPKSAPYLRLKNNKRTSKCQVFSSTVPVWVKIEKKSDFFLKFFKFFWYPVSRIVPKHVKWGPLEVF